MSHTETGLMKQTKKQLIEIILRKDDTENAFRKELADLQLDFDKAKNMITSKDSTIKGLNKELNESKINVNEHQAAIDDMVVDIANAEHKYKVCKGWNIVFGIAIVILVAALIIF